MNSTNTIMVGIASLRRGGAERVVSLLTQEWAKTHRVFITLFDQRVQAYPVGGTIISLDVHASNKPLVKIKNFFVRCWAIRRLLLKWRPHRIFTFGESANFPFLFAALSTNSLRRLTISIHNPPQNVSHLFWYPMKLFYSLVPKIVVVGKGLVREVEKFIKTKRGAVVHIPNPIDLKLIARQKEKSNQVHPRPFFLAMGRLEYQKGFDLLLEAYFNIKEHCDADLIIIGEGSQKGKLQSLIRQYGLEKRVFLLPSTPNPFPYFFEALAFILSSRYEGWGIVIVEAMACRTPVIAFNCPVGPRQIVGDNQWGLLVPPENTKELAKTILNLYGDPVKRKFYGERGYQRAQDFLIEKIAPQWLKDHGLI